MSAALGDFGGTFAGAVTAGGGAGLGLEATEELSQPPAASAKAATKSRFALLVMINPFSTVWRGTEIGAALTVSSSKFFARASEMASATACNRSDTIRSETNRLRNECGRGRPCRRARGRGDYRRRPGRGNIVRRRRPGFARPNVRRRLRRWWWGKR